jgi:hypothetical protein
MAASKRKFYKTVVKVVVLSEEPLGNANGLLNLEAINYAITDGDCSGEVCIGESQAIGGKAMAKALLSQGSDPAFFLLNEDGTDAEAT